MKAINAMQKPSDKEYTTCHSCYQVPTTESTSAELYRCKRKAKAELDASTVVSDTGSVVKSVVNGWQSLKAVNATQKEIYATKKFDVTGRCVGYAKIC